MRTWPGLAAIGAGLIHLGSAPGTTPAVLVLLVLVGGAELLWGVAALSRAAPPVPLRAAAGLLVVLLLTVEALLLPPAAGRTGSPLPLGLPLGAILGAGLLDLVVGGLIGAHLARGRRAPEEQRPLPFLLAAAAGAVAVAVVTTQSLVDTAVGGSMQM